MRVRCNDRVRQRQYREEKNARQSRKNEPLSFLERCRREHFGEPRFEHSNAAEEGWLKAWAKARGLRDF